MAVFLLPWDPDIQLGAKQDGPPRWTRWLESWYVAYDELVWELLRKDDAEDERFKTELRATGLRLLEEGVSEQTLAPYEELHHRTLSRRLLRRQRLYLLDLSRQRFLNYHKSLPEREALAKAETGDESLMCPFPPASIWPLYSPHPHGSLAYTQKSFIRQKYHLSFRLYIPDYPSLDAPYLRKQLEAYCETVWTGRRPPPLPEVELPSRRQRIKAELSHLLSTYCAWRKGSSCKEEARGNGEQEEEQKGEEDEVLVRFPIGI